MSDLRDQFFDELMTKLNDAGIKAIIRLSYPINGATIKLNGTALFKVLKVPNPFKRNGVAIYRKLSPDVILKLGGKRMRGKNDWVGAPLTTTNYSQMMEILFGVAERANHLRNVKMGKAILNISPVHWGDEEKEFFNKSDIKSKVKPKKRRI